MSNKHRHDKYKKKYLAMKYGGSESDPLPDGWVSHYSKEYKRNYYHNNSTGESTWDKPLLVVDEGSGAHAVPPLEQPSMVQVEHSLEKFGPEINAISGDGQFTCGGARSDGHCGIWSVLIAWSLLNRQDLIRNGELLGIERQPDTLLELKHTIIRVCDTLLQDGIIDVIKSVEPWFDIEEWEISVLKAQLEMPIETLQSIQGQGVFTILALLLGVNIIVLDKATRTISSFGNSENDNVRISTNGAHYYPINNRSRKWWDQQWLDHPITKDLSPTLAPSLS